MAAAAAQPDPWRAIVAGSNVVLDAGVDPAVRRIVLTDDPAVLGLVEWREADQSCFLGNLKMPIEAAMAHGLIEPQPIDPLAHIIFGALHEALMPIRRGEDKAAARRSVTGAVERLCPGRRGHPAHWRRPADLASPHAAGEPLTPT
jgi:hypothetical protein